MNININVVIDALKEYTHNDLEFISDIQSSLLNSTVNNVKNYFSMLNNEIIFLSCCIIYDLFYKKTKDIYYIYPIDAIDKYYHHRAENVLIFDNHQEIIVQYFVAKYCKIKGIEDSVEFGDYYIKRTSIS